MERRFRRVDLPKANRQFTLHRKLPFAREFTPEPIKYVEISLCKKKQYFCLHVIGHASRALLHKLISEVNAKGKALPNDWRSSWFARSLTTEGMLILSYLILNPCCTAGIPLWFCAMVFYEEKCGIQAPNLPDANRSLYIGPFGKDRSLHNLSHRALLYCGYRPSPWD